MNELRRRRSSFASRRRRRGKLRPRLRLLPPLKSATSPAPTLFRRPHVWRRKNLSSLCRLVCSSSMKSSWGHGVCACVVRSTSTKQMIVRTNSHSFSPSSPTHSICPSDFALSVEAPKLSIPFCFCLAYILLPFCLLHCSSFRPHIHIQRSPLSHSRRLSSSRPENRVHGSSFEEDILPRVAFTTKLHAYVCVLVWKRARVCVCAVAPRGARTACARVRVRVCVFAARVCLGIRDPTSVIPWQVDIRLRCCLCHLTQIVKLNP